MQSVIFLIGILIMQLFFFINGKIQQNKKENYSLVWETPEASASRRFLKLAGQSWTKETKIEYKLHALLANQPKH